MAASLKWGRQYIPLFTQVRYKGKFQTKHPRPRKIPRRIFDEITVPILPPDNRTEADKCMERFKMFNEKQRSPNPYEEFIFKQCQKMFQESRMILVCQKLPFAPELQRKIRNNFLREGLDLQSFSNLLMRRACHENQYANMIPWFVGQNLYVTGKEPNVVAATKVLRKTPQMLLLGGLVEDRLLTRDAVMNLAKLPPIENVLGELVSIMNLAASKSLSLLGSHQHTLSANLEQYVRQCQEKAACKTTEDQA
ncbi:hypothetical protein ACJMK2_014386 [Sinanodonta woodiana]|uniref:Large ribosomal subunit protein uL10m n=1 Tax=Sinanodonta woodiana TaxID=1069815 RepID=A0ABD3V0J5_SINWO